jgi:DNA-binding response OmpR family regulator
MRSLSPITIAAELCNTNIGLIGFQPLLATSLAELLESVGAASTSLGPLAADEVRDLDRCDALLVGVEEEQVPQVLELVSVRKPWLLIGPEACVRRNGILNLRADDVVFAPFAPNELLFRLCRVLQRRMVVHLEPGDSHKSMVLIAEDDPSMAALLKSVLSVHNLDCHVVTNGRDALSATRQLMPDLVVLDIDMPILNGLDVLRMLREDPGTKCIKVILLTASEELDHVRRGASLHADDYICKPFGHLMLTSRIKKLLGPPLLARPERTMTHSSL